jgi:dihydrofolate reductase
MWLRRAEPPDDPPPGDRSGGKTLGAIKVHEITTMDGIVDAPTWTFEYGFPKDLTAAVGALTGSSSAILLGRTTFEMFAPAWSSRTVEDDPGVPFFNETRKYVVSSTLTDADAVWSNSTAIGGYATTTLRALKNQVPGDLYVSGSATLVRALIADGLVDELHLFVYPVTIGKGRRLFPEGGLRRPMSLLGAEGLSNGVAHLTYGPEIVVPRSSRPTNSGHALAAPSNHPTKIAEPATAPPH